jgi:transcriptional regulator with XRE-family HTH domain
MSIGNRIKFFRKLRGLTQQELGLMLGFSEKTAYVRIAQYEAHTHIPKKSLIKRFATANTISAESPSICNDADKTS